MSYKCRYRTKKFDCLIELSPSEYKELMDLKESISQKKKEFSDLLEMYEKLEPSRVYKTPREIEFFE